MGGNRKVIGIGETVLDIIFKDNQPITAKPGGSTFNALVSLGRTKTHSIFISDIGQDKVGNIILDFLKKNNVDSSYVNRHKASKTALSLAFLNDRNDAEYEFYKDYLNQKPHSILPDIKENDILLFGSFYAVNPNIRYLLVELLKKAKACKAIIYYDPNFRASHISELEDLRSALLENMRYASFVRGSDEDFDHIFGTSEIEQVQQTIGGANTNLLITKNKFGVDYLSANQKGHVKTKEIKPLSTIGAGDNFNAGFIFALLAYNVTYDHVNHLSTSTWKTLIKTAIKFSTEVCLSYDNYISLDFANELQLKNKK